MTIENNERPKLPPRAAQVAASAVEAKDEFDPMATLRFPYLKHEESMLSADMRVPSSWQAHIRVAYTDTIRIPQLYIQVSNRPEQRLVRYNTATRPGGQEEKLEYITYRQVENLFSSSSFWYEEHMAVTVPPKMLADYLDKPLRIQISRPDSSVAFVVEVPSEYIAGVLYRLDPEEYEIDAAQVPPAHQSVTASPTEPVDIRWLKKAGWIGLAVGLVGAFVLGFGAGVTVGGFVAMIAAIVLHKSPKNTPPES
ncbi:hypothetical protein GJ698_06435 [Pseudoduganella sp. FT26W]|uniref:Uncharacterized protein n=1 Tax=Duganella aquatilis TaxID=2666082 RepID=A0A844D847_9BURK|nr:hypothetical protein [Duganella aquatilis]MRW83730.1 hypothetical protein [Duganella aquatilis]